MPYTGIHNENEFYSHHYLAEIFSGDIQATLERWREQAESANTRTPWAELRALAPEYLRFRGDFNREQRAGQRILRQREWFRALLAALDYPYKPAKRLEAADFDRVKTWHRTFFQPFAEDEGGQIETI